MCRASLLAAGWLVLSGCNALTSATSARGDWGMAEELWRGSQPACDTHARPRLAFDSSGAAWGAWSGSDGAGCRVWVSRFSPSGKWSEPRPIDAPLAEKWVSFVRLGVAANGIATAVWAERLWWQRPRFASLWASRHAPATGWSRPEPIGLADGEALWPDLAVDTAGRALVVWAQDGPRAVDLWANRLTTTGRWTGPERLAASSSGRWIQIFNHHAALGERGDALAAWAEYGSEQSDVIRAIRFDSARGWGLPTTIADVGMPDPHKFIRVYDAAALPDGSLLATWARYDYGDQSRFDTARFDPALGWRFAGNLDERIELEAVMRATLSGKVLALWKRHEEGAGYELRLARLRRGSAWEALGALPLDGPPYALDLAVDGLGQGFAAWRREGAGAGIWASRFAGGGGWEPPQRLRAPLESEPSQASVSVAADERGGALALWVGQGFSGGPRSGGDTSVFANRYAER